MGKLDDRVAVVTGSGSGIGQASAIHLAAEGAAVVVADINLAGAEATVATIKAAGGAAIAVAVDVAIESAIVAMLEAAVSEFGRLDILHNNAAALNAEVAGRDRKLADMDLEVWERTLAVNLTGPMLTTKYAIPRMLEVGGGAIVNTVSTSAFVGDGRLTAYSVSKAGLVALTYNTATQYGKMGIRCNGVAPGLIVSDYVRSIRDPASLAVATDEHLTPRLGKPDDIANAVVYLASDEAAFVTGHILHVDGGFLSHAPWLNRYPTPESATKNA